jgi:hypothetical protein
MSSHSDHDHPSLCRNPFTRSPWALPLLLLIASPVSRVVAVGGTLTFGTGCAEPHYEDCDQFLSECLETCVPNDAECLAVCELDHRGCMEAAYEAEVERGNEADAIADAALACVAVAACTLESIGDSHEEDDNEYPEPEPVPEPNSNDDWGEDWGEQNPSDELELVNPAEYSDLPEE